MEEKLVSIIAPVYNEESAIQEFIRRLGLVITSLEKSYCFEIILVDDGSKDHSLQKMKEIIRDEPRLRIIQLRRNYGQTAALQAGLDAANGEILITMDADLQHFPEDIPAFLQKISEGYDLVCGWRYARAEGILRRWPSRIANNIIRRISRLQIHDFGTTFRCYRAEFAKDLRLLGEFHRYLPVMILNMGGLITEIPIENIERPLGKSNYGIARTFGVILDLFILDFLTKYLDRPLRAFGKIASISLGFGAVIIIWLVIYAYSAGIQAVMEHIGWFMISIVFILASVQILLTGILAEILVRVFYSQGDRRVYSIRQEFNKGNPS